MKRILVTGSKGYIGSLLFKRLTEMKSKNEIELVIGTDIRGETEKANGYFKLDVRDWRLEDLLKEYKIDCIVHLACIVTPGKKSNRELEYSIDVLGTKNVLDCSLRNKVKRVIISSSGAAYGYYPENIHPLKESDPIRGNEAFAYSHHKRIVEEMLADYRLKYPDLEQTIFRISTILGEKVSNQITDLFKKPVQIGVMGSSGGFNFIWDQDVVSCFIKAIKEDKTGIYNLAGDGVIDIHERAKILKKPVLLLPSLMVEKSLHYLKKFGLTQYGPEQILFLKHRPMLDNKKLKEEFGFIPEKTSKEVLEFYAKTL